VLTRRGWWMTVAVVGLIVSGRLFGLPELYALSVASAAAVAGALLYVRYFPWKIEAFRDVRPPQVEARGSSRVELSVRNIDTRRSPVLSARDPFDRGRRWARFHVAPLEPGEVIRAAYRLPTGERGIFPLGPLEVGVTDPFALATRVLPSAPLATLTVFPHVDEIRPLPQARSANPSGFTSKPSVGAGGEDFYALRPYEMGDDLRRVHWASTARQDELMIRQDELPWQGRITVLADLRSSVHTPASLEVVLSAVASIVRSSILDQRQVRLLATDGTDTGFGGGQPALRRAYEYLAGADTHEGTALAASLAALARDRDHGGVSTVTTDLASDGDLAALGRLASRYSSEALVVFGRSSWDPAAPSRDPGRRRPRRGTVEVSAELPFADAWNRAMRSPLSEGARP
jgi:uncharacterized protein (DUF58 family)